MAQKSGNHPPRIIIPGWYLWTTIVLNLISAAVLFFSESMTVRSVALDYFLYGYTAIVFFGWMAVNVWMLLTLRKVKAKSLNYLLPGYYVLFMTGYVGAAYLITYQNIIIPSLWYTILDLATSFFEVMAAIVFLEMKKKEHQETTVKNAHQDDHISDEIERINETVRRYSKTGPEKSKKRKKS